MLSCIPYDLFIEEDTDEHTSNESNETDLFRLMKILRFVRILRLLRLAKVKAIIMKIEDQITNDSIYSYITFIKIIIGIFFIGH